MAKGRRRKAVPTCGIYVDGGDKGVPATVDQLLRILSGPGDSAAIVAALETLRSIHSRPVTISNNVIELGKEGAARKRGRRARRV